MEKKRTSVIDAFWLLTSTDDRLKSKAIELINTAINEVDLKRLDSEFRQRTSFEWTIDWRNKSPNNLIPSICTDEEKITILGLSSFHPNGYFREKAIKELFKYDIKRVFPFLIIRVNDWVPAIRTINKKMLLEKIDTQNIHLIIQYLPLLNKLKFATRDN